MIEVDQSRREVNLVPHKQLQPVTTSLALRSIVYCAVNLNLNRGVRGIELLADRTLE